METWKRLFLELFDVEYSSSVRVYGGGADVSLEPRVEVDVFEAIVSVIFDVAYFVYEMV